MKINNMTSKTSLEIQESDVLIIQDGEDTKQISIKELKEYFLNQGISKNTKMLINETLDNVINSLKTSKYIISELVTYKMNVTINDASSGDIYITLKSTNTDKWLTKEDIHNLLMPNEEGLFSKNFVINVLISDIYVKSSYYTIHDVSELDQVVPEGNIGCIKAHFDNLTQNEIANITYDDIIITTENTEITIVFPIEDTHEYNFIGDPDLFNNNVPYTQNIG